MRREMSEKERLPLAVDKMLRRSNPWWTGAERIALPPYRRWAFHIALKKLQAGVAPIVALRGPRQVGKTTLQEQVIDHLLSTGTVQPHHILRVQFDEIPSLGEVQDPVLAIARWYEDWILDSTFNGAAHQGQPAYLFFDEIQNLDAWAPQLKSLVDHHTVKAFVTGSSALRIEAGRDSLAGRITSVELGTLLLREIAALRFGDDLKPFLPDNGLEPLRTQAFWQELQAYGVAHAEQRDRAFAAFSERGGYPLTHVRADMPWPEVADLLNETVIQRVIQHDLRFGRKGARRDAHVLEGVFRAACYYAGQSPGQSLYLDETRRALGADVGWQRILAYLKLLDGSMLLKLVRPLELRLKRPHGNYKLCLCDHALRASLIQEQIPIHAAGLASADHLRDLAGHIVESVVGYFLGGMPHLGLAHLPAREPSPEVDYVMTVGDVRIPVEIKYQQRIDSHRDTFGLRAFIEKTVYNTAFGILVTLDDSARVLDPRIVCISLPSLLLLR